MWVPHGENELETKRKMKKKLVGKNEPKLNSARRFSFLIYKNECVVFNGFECMSSFFRWLSVDLKTKGTLKQRRRN